LILKDQRYFAFNTYGGRFPLQGTVDGTGAVCITCSNHWLPVTEHSPAGIYRTACRLCLLHKPAG